MFFMAAVAKRFIATGFAGAPRDLFFFGDLNEHGPHARGAVAAVTKGLVFTLPTGAPHIATRFCNHD